MVPRVVPPRTVSKHQPQWVIADWLGLVEFRRTAAPGEDIIPPPDHKSFNTPTYTKNRRRRRQPSGRYRFIRCGGLGNHPIGCRRLYEVRGVVGSGEDRGPPPRIIVHSTRSTIEVTHFHQNCFRMTGILNPKPSEYQDCFEK